VHGLMIFAPAENHRGDDNHQELEHLLTFFLALAWYFGMSYLCWFFRDRTEDLFTVKIIAMHIGVFISIECFSPLQQHFVESQMSTAEPSVWIGFYYLLFALVVMGAIKYYLSELSSNIRKSMQAWNESDLSGPRWMEVAEECENEFSGMLFGFLVAKGGMSWAASAIQPSSCDHHYCGQTTDALNNLGMVWLLSMALLYMASCWRILGLPAPWATIHIKDYLEIHGMYTAFWLAFTGIIHIFHKVIAEDMPEYSHSRVIEAITTAFCTSPLVIGGIVLIDKLGDTGTLNDATANRVLVCIGLFTGLVWERAFDASLTAIVSNDFVEAAGYSPEAQNVFTAVLTMCVVFTLLPALHWYIMPVASLEIPKRFPGSKDDGDNDVDIYPNGGGAGGGGFGGGGPGGGGPGGGGPGGAGGARGGGPPGGGADDPKMGQEDVALPPAA